MKTVDEFINEMDESNMSKGIKIRKGLRYLMRLAGHTRRGDFDEKAELIFKLLTQLK